MSPLRPCQPPARVEKPIVVRKQCHAILSSRNKPVLDCQKQGRRNPPRRGSGSKRKRMPIKMMPKAISRVNQNRTELGPKRSFADMTTPPNDRLASRIENHDPDLRIRLSTRFSDTIRKTDFAQIVIGMVRSAGSGKHLE